MKEIEKIAVMGFGNPVRSDDGVGVYVIEELKKKSRSLSKKVNFFDMGTSTFEVLFKLNNHNKIFLIDAVVNTTEPIGTLFKVPAEEVLAAPQEDSMIYLHGMKWNQALFYAKKILKEKYPKDIEVYLIAVQDTKLGVGLSTVVKKAGDKVVEILIKEFNKLNLLSTTKPKKSVNHLKC